MADDSHHSKYVTVIVLLNIETLVNPFILYFHPDLTTKRKGGNDYNSEVKSVFGISTTRWNWTPVGDAALFGKFLKNSR